MLYLMKNSVVDILKMFMRFDNWSRHWCLKNKKFKHQKTLWWSAFCWYHLRVSISPPELIWFHYGSWSVAWLRQLLWQSVISGDKCLPPICRTFGTVVADPLRLHFCDWSHSIPHVETNPTSSRSSRNSYWKLPSWSWWRAWLVIPVPPRLIFILVISQASTRFTYSNTLLPI